MALRMRVYTVQLRGHRCSSVQVTFAEEDYWLCRLFHGTITHVDSRHAAKLRRPESQGPENTARRSLVSKFRILWSSGPSWAKGRKLTGKIPRPEYFEQGFQLVYLIYTYMNINDIYIYIYYIYRSIYIYIYIFIYLCISILIFISIFMFIHIYIYIHTYL